MGVRCNTKLYSDTWWGEGEFKAYIDGDTDFPTICGTGVEDYIGTAWGQDYYYDLYCGCPVYVRQTWNYAFIVSMFRILFTLTAISKQLYSR